MHEKFPALTPIIFIDFKNKNTRSSAFDIDFYTYQAFWLRRKHSPISRQLKFQSDNLSLLAVHNGENE